jgi:phage major head subunit gpT-like protein
MTCERCKKRKPYDQMVRVVHKLTVVTSEYSFPYWFCLDCDRAERELLKAQAEKAEGAGK